MLTIVVNENKNKKIQWFIVKDARYPHKLAKISKNVAFGGYKVEILNQIEEVAIGEFVDAFNLVEDILKRIFGNIRIVDDE